MEKKEGEYEKELGTSAWVFQQLNRSTSKLHLIRNILGSARTCLVTSISRRIQRQLFRGAGMLKEV